jgi:hypothetical protein
MDLRHLQTFKVIAETGSFVQAAERLQYAQLKFESICGNLGQLMPHKRSGVLYFTGRFEL